MSSGTSLERGKFEIFLNRVFQAYVYLQWLAKLAMGYVFPCQLSVLQMLHTHLSGVGIMGPLKDGVPSGLSLTPPELIAIYLGW
jgi:hypothetical protein